MALGGSAHKTDVSEQSDENQKWFVLLLPFFLSHPPSPLVASCLYSQALTEVSVLSDLLQIAKHHHNYIALDPVIQQSSAAVEASPSYQIIAKKKVRLGAGSGRKQ